MDLSLSKLHPESRSPEGERREALDPLQGGAGIYACVDEPLAAGFSRWGNFLGIRISDNCDDGDQKQFTARPSVPRRRSGPRWAGWRPGTRAVRSPAPAGYAIAV